MLQQSVSVVDDRAMEPRLRRWARVGVGAAVVVLALTAASVAIAPPPEPCGDLARGYPPIIAFELARDGGDLRALFGAPGPCRDRMVAAMDSTNHLDLALFMPAYGLLLAAFAASSPRASARRRRLGVGLAIAAVAADALENLCLLALTPALAADSPWLARLPWATGAKWVLLGACGAVAATIVVGAGRAGKVGAAACALAPVLTIGAVVAPATFGPVVTGGVAASWLVCVVALVARARRATPAS